MKAIADAKGFALPGALEDARSPLIGWDSGIPSGWRASARTPRHVDRFQKRVLSLAYPAFGRRDTASRIASSQEGARQRVRNELTTGSQPSQQLPLTLSRHQ